MAILVYVPKVCDGCRYCKVREPNRFVAKHISLEPHLSGVTAELQW